MRQPPWLSIAAAHQAAPSLHLATGIAVAFPRSPMVTAQIGVGARRGHRAGGSGSVSAARCGPTSSAATAREFDPPVARLRDYVLAVRACWAGVPRRRPLAHDGRFYRLSLLPAVGVPRRHELRGHAGSTSPPSTPWMVPHGRRGRRRRSTSTRCTPSHYLHQRLLPGAGRGRGAGPAATVGDVDLLDPGVHRPGRHPRGAGAAASALARTQIAFYGSTRNYAFQFDDLGFEGTSARLNERLKAGDLAGHGRR